MLCYGRGEAEDCSLQVKREEIAGVEEERVEDQALTHPPHRWEIPRSSYPATKAGYLSWRTFLKKRQADLASAICIGCNYTPEEASALASLIRKEDLKNNEETQIPEDVACLVFLEEQLEDFSGREEFGGEGEGDKEGEEKLVGILRKSWAKMSEKGRELAGRIQMSDRVRELVGRAVGG